MLADAIRCLPLTWNSIYDPKHPHFGRKRAGKAHIDSTPVRTPVPVPALQFMIRKPCLRKLSKCCRGTSSSLKRLLIDNAYAGDDVAHAIASAGSCLQELSMPCCTGLTDVGLRCIAAACTQLRRLSVGGPARCAWYPSLSGFLVGQLWRSDPSVHLWS